MKAFFIESPDASLDRIQHSGDVRSSIAYARYRDALVEAALRQPGCRPL
jgi:hypothetical protein